MYFVTFKSAEGFNLPEEARNIAFDSIKFHMGKKYKLYACVVMGSHVHLILRPLEKARGAFYSLAEIMHSIKSYSANRIQKYLHKKGNIWLDENYDRVIRDEKEYVEKVNYILNNPIKAGLVENPEDYKWLFFEGGQVRVSAGC